MQHTQQVQKIAEHLIWYESKQKTLLLKLTAVTLSMQAKKLSCRIGLATLHTIGNFAKSLKVIQNYTSE